MAPNPLLTPIPTSLQYWCCSSSHQYVRYFLLFFESGTCDLLWPMGQEPIWPKQRLKELLHIGGCAIVVLGILRPPCDWVPASLLEDKRSHKEEPQSASYQPTASQLPDTWVRLFWIIQPPPDFLANCRLMKESSRNQYSQPRSEELPMQPSKLWAK